MRHWQEQTALEISPAKLFPTPPVIRFGPEQELCSCGGLPTVQKTRRKTVLSMTGPFIAHETLTQCPGCHRAFGSDALQQLVPRCCNVGYDLLVFVGQALFRRHLSVYEVRVELVVRNIRLSPSAIDYLGKKFITQLALAHREASPRIREAMTAAGGYILHLDATVDGDSPALMTGLDSLSQFVLANVKLPSEHSDHIIPFLQRIKSEYGTPLACVHDMGTGIGKAVATIFPGTRDFICHFHFLRDIGKDYLEPAYARLRKCLRSLATSTELHALVREVRQLLGGKSARCASQAKAIAAGAPVVEDIRLMPLTSVYSLALWALQGKQQGDGYGFPFDRPLFDFAQRLLALDSLMPQLLDLLPNDEQPRENHPLFKLLAQACYLAEDQEAVEAVEELRWRGKVFDRLRAAMRIAPAGGGKGLNDEGTDEAMSTIRQAVQALRRELDTDPKLASDPLSQKMAKQIDKYGEKLFADPITAQSPAGPVTIYPQRTNNILEQFFRDVKRGYRRKTGNNTMRRALQTMLADTPLVKNLDNPAYMKLLLDGKATLEELFASLDAANLKKSEQQVNNDRILPGFRPLLNLADLPNKIIRSLGAHAKVAKSN